MFKVLVAVASMAVLGCTAFPSQPANPIIAVVTTPLVDCLGWATPPPDVDYSGGCLESYYVRWLEAAGIRVVPLIWNLTWSAKLPILQNINGVLFPGGSLGGEHFTHYVNNATEIFNYAVTRNHDNSDPFFLWGTCQGFQVLGVIAAQTQDVLKCIYHGVDPQMMSLNFTSYQPESVMFGARATSPQNIVSILKTQNSTLNWHSCGINPSDFESHIATMGKIFTVISTNTDVNGLPFISSYEGSQNGLNFFATQFHPERVPYEFSNDIIGHTPDDVRVSQYLALFIRSRLKMNNHTYPSAAAANSATVENFPLINLGWGSEVYWIH
jgi:gamma-glutamyl hydrolase